MGSDTYSVCEEYRDSSLVGLSLQYVNQNTPVGLCCFNLCHLTINIPLALFAVAVKVRVRPDGLRYIPNTLP